MTPISVRKSSRSSWTKAQADPAFAARVEQSYNRIIALKRQCQWIRRVLRKAT